MKVTTYPIGQSGKKRKKKAKRTLTGHRTLSGHSLPDPKYEFLKRFRGEIKNAP